MNAPHSAADRLSAALSGRYRIERELGAGGMATVYLAEDLKHDRKVAIKVLKPELAAVLGAERFVVEIKTTAALSHPHILPLFDSGTADSFLFYVMPYIQGETIREQLNRETQFGVAEAVRIAREVADALDYAHRHGVIHRDIKPENILLHDGRAMVMDFGIALAVSAAAGGRMTETGLSLGTPHYMSPEQATAEKEITARSDQYSLASVLYEMLTGAPPHVGGSAQQIIMRIITDTPRPVTELRRAAPPNVAAAVARALEKLPADRFESAKAFSDALGTAGFTHELSARTGVMSARSVVRNRASLWIAWGAATLFAGVAAAGWLRREEPPQPARLDVSTTGLTLTLRDMVISPDGSMLAVPASKGNVQGIYVRRLDGEAEFRMLPGTEGGIMPAFSPDSRWIVFRNEPKRLLAKVSVSGGGTVTVMPAGAIDPYSPQWGTDSHIVFSSPQGNYMLAASGASAPQLLAKVTGRTPFLLPDGSGILFSATGTMSFYEFAGDTAISLGISGGHIGLIEGQFLTYLSETGGLAAIRFDRRKRAVVGTPISVAERVGATLNIRGYSIAANGTMVLSDAPNALSFGGATNRFLVVTIGGPTDTLPLPPARRLLPQFSPNGRVIAYEQMDAGRIGQTDIHTFDLVTGTATQLTFNGDNDNPVWSPDGKQILFNRLTGNGEDLHVKPADGSRPEQLVLTMPGDQWPSQWVRNDLVVLHSRKAESVDLLLWNPTDSAPPRPYLDTPWFEMDLRVAPDGKLAAFTSTERGGQLELWIRDFPVPQGKWRLTTGQTAAPRWSSDGRYLFYTHGGGGSGIDTVYRVRIDRTPSVTVGKPEVLFTLDIDGIANWDLSPDAKRFVVAASSVAAAGPTDNATASAEPRFVITLNWVAMLKRQFADQRP